MNDLFNLQGQVALVSGASSGIGVDMAKAYARYGANIVVTGRRKERLDEVAAEIKELGVDCIGVVCDVTDTESVENCVKEVMDHYGRFIPKHSHGTVRLEKKTSSTRIIMASIMKLFDEIIKDKLLVRRVNISANNLISEEMENKQVVYKQFDLFSDSKQIEETRQKEKIDRTYEKKLQLAMLNIKNKYGKNSILKAMNLESGATTIQRNAQIGGHRG